VYFCVLRLIAVLLPPGKTPFAVQLNNNNRNNNFENNQVYLWNAKDCGNIRACLAPGLVEVSSEALGI
jgi:hypothetical protein